TASLGSGQAFVTIDDSDVGGGTSVTGSTIAGNLSITTGTSDDVIAIGNSKPVTIGGTTTINTGLNVTGADSVKIDDTAFLNPVSLIFGGGDDALNVKQNGSAGGITTFAEKLTVNMGAGNDTASFGVSGDGLRQVLCRVLSSLDGGTGSNDVLNIFF